MELDDTLDAKLAENLQRGVEFINDALSSNLESSSRTKSSGSLTGAGTNGATGVNTSNAPGPKSDLSPEDGGSILVHCLQGMSRSCSFVVAYCKTLSLPYCYYSSMPILVFFLYFVLFMPVNLRTIRYHLTWSSGVEHRTSFPFMHGKMNIEIVGIWCFDVLPDQ